MGLAAEGLPGLWGPLDHGGADEMDTQVLSEQQQEKVRWALGLAEQGFGIFPVWSATAEGVCKCPKGGECTSPAKHPISGHGFQDSTTDPDRIRTFMAAGSEPNYGVRPPEGITVLDIDGPDVERLADLPATMRVKTANGYHAYYDTEGLPINGQLLGVVTRTHKSGYVLGPGSVHASGYVYALEDRQQPVTAFPADRVTPPRSDGFKGFDVPLDRPEPGQRHEWLRNQARYVHGRIGHLGPEAVEGAMQALNRTLTNPKTPEEVRQAIGHLEAFSVDTQSMAVGDWRSLMDIPNDPLPPLLLDRLHPEQHTILYGTGGVGKGTLAAKWAGALAKDGYTVAILDFEGNPQEWRSRIGGITGDDRDIMARVMHRTYTGDLLEHAKAGLAEQLAEMGVDYIIVDSIVMACGGDALKPEAAKGYTDALNIIGKPVLSLAHVTKGDAVAYPFGTIFWHNTARLTWSLVKEDGAQWPVLTNRKSNNYAVHAPMNVLVDYTGGELRAVDERPAAPAHHDTALPVSRKDEVPAVKVAKAVALGPSDGSTEEEVVAATGLSPDEVRTILRSPKYWMTNQRYRKAGQS
jgi:hypothetical protein